MKSLTGKHERKDNQSTMGRHQQRRRPASRVQESARGQADPVQGGRGSENELLFILTASEFLGNFCSASTVWLRGSERTTLNENIRRDAIPRVRFNQNLGFSPLAEFGCAGPRAPRPANLVCQGLLRIRLKELLDKKLPTPPWEHLHTPTTTPVPGKVYL